MNLKWIKDNFYKNFTKYIIIDITTSYILYTNLVFVYNLVFDKYAFDYDISSF